MAKLFKDILRDKGSSKYSITKSLAFFGFTFLISYLGYYLFYLSKDIDHTLVIELLGFIGALVGLKNNWGARAKNEESTPKKPTPPSVVSDSVDDEAH